jgi:hypothetical protein
MTIRCESCDNPVGRSALVRDHCHECGGDNVRTAPTDSHRGLICSDCNTALSRHLIQHLDSIVRYIDAHECPPSLFPLADVKRTSRRSPTETAESRRLYLGQGPHDPRFIRVSCIPGTFTVEQVAVMLQVAAGTARDLIYGRRGRLGFMTNGTVLVEHHKAIALFTERTRNGTT